MATRGRPRSFDRDAVLDKAIRMFWRDGYAATSIRDLTDDLGIGAPSLYSAFGNKQHLFAEAVRVYDRQYGGFIDAALAEEPTAAQAAARILREGPSRYTRRGLPSGCLIVTGDAGTTDPAVRDTLHRLREEKTAQLAAKIAHDVTRRTLPADTDPEPLARYTMTVLGALAQQARDGVSRAQLEQVASVAIRAWPQPLGPGT